MNSPTPDAVGLSATVTGIAGASGAGAAARGLWGARASARPPWDAAVAAAGAETVGGLARPASLAPPLGAGWQPTTSAASSRAGARRPILGSRTLRAGALRPPNKLWVM